MTRDVLRFLLYSLALVLFSFFVSGVIILLPYIKADKIDSLESARTFMQHQQLKVLFLNLFMVLQFTLFNAFFFRRSVPLLYKITALLVELSLLFTGIYFLFDSLGKSLF